MNAPEMYLLIHSRSHGVEMQDGMPDALTAHLRVPPRERHLGDRLEDAAVFGLNDEQIRHRPAPGQNSIAWLIWHMARTEDACVNAVVAGRPQVIDDGWPQRLNLAARDVGAGMADDEVADFCARVNVDELRSYRAAVGRRTVEVARALPTDAWDRPVDPANVERAVSAGVIRDNAAWVRDFWRGRTNAWFLALVTGHNYYHIGEAVCVRSQAGHRLPV